MRKIPSPPGGFSAQWRDGWAIGYEQCLIAHEREHEEKADGPRTWAMPAKPEDVAQVRGRNGVVYDVARLSDADWYSALRNGGPLTEVVETEAQAAARRLRAAGFEREPAQLPSSKYDDMRTVLNHVLNGGTL